MLFTQETSSNNKWQNQDVFSQICEVIRHDWQLKSGQLTSNCIFLKICKSQELRTLRILPFNKHHPFTKQCLQRSFMLVHYDQNARVCQIRSFCRLIQNTYGNITVSSKVTMFYMSLARVTCIYVTKMCFLVTKSPILIKMQFISINYRLLSVII